MFTLVMTQLKQVCSRGLLILPSAYCQILTSIRGLLTLPSAYCQILTSIGGLLTLPSATVRSSLVLGDC